jgi:N-acetyl-S-(2-succino)cysteine monooxygenase
VIHLACFFGGLGQHQAAWRRVSSRAEEASALGLHAEMATTAERGLFDAIFIADGLFLDTPRTVREPMGLFEPITMLSAMAARTERIGLIGSVSTTFSAPYNVARQFAALDLISGGRAGWNIVTSSGGAENFGDEPLPSHDERYRRAGEFVETVVELWNSWGDDAILVDRERGMYVDPDRIRPIDHRGGYFSVAGPLNLPRSAQGQPVLVQAGSSEDGRRFAATHAEIVFTAQPALADSVAFTSDLKARVAAAGRDPGKLRVLPGVCPVIGSTEAEARAALAELGALTDMKMGLTQLQQQLGGVELDGLDLDAPIPAELLPDAARVQGRQSRYELFKRLATEDKLTLRELIGREVAATGHWLTVGTPEQIAERLAERHLAGSGDGYVVLPATMPDGLELFVEHVVPLLQQRGLYRQEYSGTTLREHLELDRPASTFSQASEAVSR